MEVSIHHLQFLQIDEWLAYALALNFQPLLPLVGPNVDERAIGETRIGLMKDLALETKNGVLGIYFFPFM